MKRTVRRIGSVAALLTALVATLLTTTVGSEPAGAARPRPTTTTATTTPRTGSFTFGLGFPSWTGASYVIRDGGTLPFPTGSHGPFYELYGYVSNSIYAQSLNGFDGTITVAVDNLPPGVTIEEQPTVIALAPYQSRSISLRIRVAPTVPLGTIVSGITISGTSGGVTRTSTVPTFTVVDPLPCSTYWAGNPCYG